MIDLFAAGGLHGLGLDFPLLTSLVALPVLGAAVIALLPKDNAPALRAVGLTASTITGLLSIFLLLAFDRHDSGFQFVTQHEWLPAFGISWKLGVDGISLFLVVLTGLIFPIALLFQKPAHDAKGYHAWMLMLMAGLMGSFLALDLFLFFVFFDAVLIPMYFLIAAWGFARRNYAAMKFFIYTLAGSAFLLVGILALAFVTSHRNGTPVTFDLVQLQQLPGVSTAEARWMFLAFAIAFAVKVPVFPFHTWAPDAYENSPIAGAVISAAVMVKLGTYGLIRFGLFLFPEAAHHFAPLLLTLAVIGMVYGAIVAAVQHDLRRLAAYASLSHLGFIVLGTFAFSSEGLAGAVLEMISHGLSTGALFLLLGMIYVRRNTTRISELGGIQKAAPVLAAVFTVVLMSLLGVPGLSGFVSEFLVLIGTFVTHRWWAVVGSSALVFGALYLLWAYQRVFHGPADDERNAKIVDLSWRERGLMVPFVVLIVFLGVYPKPVLDRIEPSVERILATTPGHVATYGETFGTPDASGSGNAVDVGGDHR